MTHISQREARRLRKQLRELEQRDNRRSNAWAQDYPGGTVIATISLAALPKENSAISTARKLKHAVVAISDGDLVRFYALPIAR